MDVFAAVSDPARREILSALARSDLSAGEVAALFPISRPGVSRHLRVLREAGLVRDELVGRRRLYRLDVDGLAPVTDWLTILTSSPLPQSGDWSGRLDALETEVRRTRRERRTSITTNTEGDRMTPTPTGQVIPTAAGRDLVLERVLPGSIDDAWASITESDRLARWFCTWTGEPRVGATLELTLVAEEGDATFQAEILACEPPTHLAVSTGAWLLESTLTPIDSNHTRLRFVHHLDEEAKSEEVGPGWEYYLDALTAAMNGNPMPDFNDYWPSLSSAYADRPMPPAT